MDTELRRQIEGHSHGSKFLELVELAEGQNWWCDLEYRKEMGGGSGALVLRVDASPKEGPQPKVSGCDPPLGKFLLKLVKRDHGQKESEITKHQIALNHALPQFRKQHMPALSKWLEDGLFDAMLFAFAKGEAIAELDKADLLDAERLRNCCKQVAGGIITGMNGKPKTSSGIAIRTFLKRWLAHRLDTDKAHFRQFVRDATGGGNVFEIQRGLYLNPLWLCEAPESNEIKQWAVKGFLHKDLHINNVLFPRTGKVDHYWVIDFAMSEKDGYLGYDHAYFEVSYLLHVFSKITGLTEEDGVIRLLRVLQHLDNPLDRVGAYPAQDAETLRSIQELRRVAEAEWKKRKSLKGEGILDDFWKQIVLARVAAGLNFLYKYAGDKKGPGQSSLKPEIVCRLAFTYAAWAATRYIDSEEHAELWRGLTENFISAAPIPPAVTTTAITFGLEKEAKFSKMVSHLAWSPDGNFLVLVEGDKPWLWQWHDGDPFFPPSFPEDGVEAIAWSADGDLLALALDNSSIRFFRRENWQAVGEIHSAHGGRPITELVWSREGLLAVASAKVSFIYLWELEASPDESKWVHRATLSGHEEDRRVISVAWSPDGKMLASGGSDRDCLVWTPTANDWSSAHFARASGHTDSVGSLAWFPDGKQLASGACEQTIRVWKIEPGAQELSIETAFRAPSKPVSCVAVSHDGKFLASKQDDSVCLWRCGSWAQPISQIPEPSIGWPFTIAFHPNSHRLVTPGPANRCVRIWHLK